MDNLFIYFINMFFSWFKYCLVLKKLGTNIIS